MRCRECGLGPGPRPRPEIFGSLILLNTGCATRVVLQILVYEHITAAAWSALPLSAVIEMMAVTLFAANMLMTLTTGPPLEAYPESLQTREAQLTVMLP